MGRARPSSKTAATVRPSCLICPSRIVNESGSRNARAYLALQTQQLVFQIYGLIIAVKFHGSRALLFRPEAGVFRAAERQLVFDTGARKIYGEQSCFGLIDVIKDAREIRGLNRR